MEQGPDERSRLAALDRCALLNTEPEPALDSLTVLAAHIAEVPIALVSLVGAERHWFKSRYGLEVPETSRDVALCQYVVDRGAELVIEDARADPRFADNPLVTGEPGVRFYMGLPLRDPDGFVLGTLCAMDQVPRKLSNAQTAMLKLLASQVVDQLEARRQRLQQAREREALSNSERRLQAVFAALSEGVVVQDVGGAITTCNTAAEGLLGLTSDQIMGRSSVDPRWQCLREDGSVFPGVEHPAMVALSSGLAQRQVIMGVTHVNGQVTWLEVNAEPVFLDEFSVPYAVATTFHDITPIRAALEAQERLAHQERLVTTGTLAAGVGHEINNPLAYVTANIELALEDLRSIGGGSPPARVRSIISALSDAHDGADRIRRIVHGLRALARAQGEIGPCSLSDAVDISVNMAMHELRHTATLHNELSPVPPVWADEPRLSQVLVNLLVNAGQSFVTSDPARNRVVIRCRHQGDRVVISVSDNGPGIGAATRERMFDPFFTTKGPREGTGLGLAICYTMVTSLDGEITYLDTPGGGATFEVSLGVAGTPPPAGLAQPSHMDSQQRKGRVLVIDDDPAVLRAITRALGAAHEVVALRDSREAWSRIEGGERFDVVFCDLMMPYLSGADLYERLEVICPDQATRFVFITGGVVDLRIETFLARIRNERIEKPFPVQSLRAIARRYVSEDSGP